MLFSKSIAKYVCTTSQDFYSFPVKVVILSYDSYFHETFLGRTKYVQDAWRRHPDIFAHFRFQQQQHQTFFFILFAFSFLTI